MLSCPCYHRRKHISDVRYYILDLNRLAMQEIHSHLNLRKFSYSVNFHSIEVLLQTRYIGISLIYLSRSPNPAQPSQSISKWSIVKSRFCAGAILSKYFQASQKDLPLASLKNAFSIMLRIYRMCFSHFSCLHTHILVLSGYPHVPESSGHPVEQLLW